MKMGAPLPPPFLPPLPALWLGNEVTLGTFRVLEVALPSSIIFSRLLVQGATVASFLLMSCAAVGRPIMGGGLYR